MGSYGYGSRNEEGSSVLDICKFHRLRILNTYFEKEEKLVTYKSGVHKTQIDLLLLRRAGGIQCTDCHVIPDEECISQHRPVRACISVPNFEMRRKREIKRIKLWKLKDEEKRNECQEKLSRCMESCHGETEKLEEHLLCICREDCGETTGRRGRERERDLVVE